MLEKLLRCVGQLISLSVQVRLAISGRLIYERVLISWRLCIANR